MTSHAKKAALLEQMDSESPSGRRSKPNWWPFILCSFLIFASVFTAAFVGGFFLGKQQTSYDDDNDGADDSNPLQKAFRVGYGDSSQIIPAFNGTVPVEEFIQCRSVMSNGKMICAPSNPLLTPKGAVQIFVYQHEDDVSLILTTTGSNYGEQVDNPSQTGEGQFTLHTSGLDGDLVQFTDGYHRLFQSIPIKSSLQLNVGWGNVGTHGVIFKLNQPDTTTGSISFSGLSGATPSLNLRGDNMHDTQLPALPTTKPITLAPYSGDIPNGPEPTDMNEQTVHTDSATGLQILAMQPNDRQKRSVVDSLLTHTFESALAFVKTDPSTGELLHRLEFHHEQRHGGSNGTVCVHSINYLVNAEGHVCYLFHNALYNGMEKNSTPNDNGQHHTMANFHYRNTADNFWSHVTVLARDILDDDVMSSLKSNKVRRSIWDFFSHASNVVRDVVGGVHKVVDDVHQVVDGVKDVVSGVKNIVSGVQQTYRDVKDTINEVKSDVKGRRRLLYNCNLGQSLYYGGKCGYSSFECGSGILGEPDSGFLDTAFTVKDCYDAGSDCYDFGKTCF